MSDEIISTFLEFSSQIKLYHWQTKNYARHIASENLYTTGGVLIDKFIEIYQGKHNLRLKIRGECSIKLHNIDDEDIVMYLYNFKGFLMEDIPQILNDGMQNTDLLNIRDELVGEVNQTLYLFTLN